MTETAVDLSISILLPIFVREPGLEEIRLIRRSLESIHDQRYPGAYEVVIVDDGSAVAFSDLATMVGARYLHGARVVRSWRNNGLVHALNTGLVEARYPWIARIDADDRWLPTKIEKQIVEIQDDPDLSICATGMVLVDPSGCPYETHLRAGGWLDILRFFVVEGCPFPHPSIVARRDVFRLLGGYPHHAAVSHCEDYALWGIWLRFFKPSMVEEVLFEYTVSEISTSARHRDQQLRASEMVRRRFMRLGIAATLPSALQGLARAIGCSLLDAGKLAYSMWRFGPTVRLPGAALPFLEAILPDRQVMTVSDVEAFEPDHVVPGLRRAAAGGRLHAVRAR